MREGLQPRVVVAGAMKEVIHYLMVRDHTATGRVRLEAWCGVEYPKNRDGNGFTHQISHATCEACKEEAALTKLAEVP